MVNDCNIYDLLIYLLFVGFPTADAHLSYMLDRYVDYLYIYIYRLVIDICINWIELDIL